MKKTLIYTAVFSAMMMVAGCGDEDDSSQRNGKEKRDQAEMEKQDKPRNGQTGIDPEKPHRPHGIAPVPVNPFLFCIFSSAH